jgi:alpha-glucoside transport system permease protein
MTAPVAVPEQPIVRASKARRTAFWRAPMLESLPLRLSVIVICLLWTLPTAGLLVTSFRNPQLITKTGWWDGLFHLFDQNQWTLSNYQQVLGGEGMGAAFLNSLIVTIPSTVIPITIAAFAAYAFAWIKFPGRGLLFIIVVALLVVPLQMALIPILKIYSGASLYGSFVGIWLAHTAFGLPLAIFLLYNFMSQLPRDLFESAAIDGASAFQTFIRIVLPLSVPALGAFAIFQFLWVWNDLLVALVFLGPGGDVRVMPTQLFLMLGPRGGAWHLLTAGAFVTMVIPLVVFLALQRFFVRGILAGSVK